MTQVEFHFDFGSPNAYLAHKLILGIEQRSGAAFVYVPILLGGVFKLTNNAAPMVQFKDVKNKLAYQRLEFQRFIDMHGLKQFRWNPHFPVNTVQIMRGAIDTAFIRENFPERYALKNRDGILNPEHIADAYWQIHCQPRDAWTFELDLRPWIERW